jgi:hypothetical protein
LLAASILLTLFGTWSCNTWSNREVLLKFLHNTMNLLYVTCSILVTFLQKLSWSCKLINRLQIHISLEKIQNLFYLINRLAHISQSKNSESLVPDHHSCSHFLQKIMMIL